MKKQIAKLALNKTTVSYLKKAVMLKGGAIKGDYTLVDELCISKVDTHCDAQPTKSDLPETKQC